LRLNHDKNGGNNNQNQQNSHFKHPPFFAAVKYTNGLQTKRASAPPFPDFTVPSFDRQCPLESTILRRFSPLSPILRGESFMSAPRLVTQIEVGIELHRTPSVWGFDRHTPTATPDEW
jgi:hypothetical protein